MSQNITSWKHNINKGTSKNLFDLFVNRREEEYNNKKNKLHPNKINKLYTSILFCECTFPNIYNVTDHTLLLCK